MKFEIELEDGTYNITVDAEFTGSAAGDCGADNPDDYYGYIDIGWTPVDCIKWDVYGNVTNLTNEQLYEVAELHRDEIEVKTGKLLIEYAREYAEDAALDAVDREFCGDY